MRNKHSDKFYGRSGIICRQSYWQFTYSMSALNVCLSLESLITGIPITWNNVIHSIVKNKIESTNTLKNSPMNFDC